MEIFVPELNEDHQQKVAQVDFDRKMVKVAESKLKTAIAQLAEAKANVEQVPGGHRSLGVGSGRLTQMVEQRVVDREVLDETQKQLSVESRDARRRPGGGRRTRCRAGLRRSRRGKPPSAQVKVAEADERRTAAMLAYTKVTAPYDGVITVRNANTGDYVQAATGDKSTSRGSPMFVIARDDLVRIFVDVPEDYARYVREGTKANVRADALSGLEIKAAVTRTSWSLAEKTRTLWAEIDLPTKNLTSRPEHRPRQTQTPPPRPTTGCGPGCTSTRR